MKKINLRNTRRWQYSGIIKESDPVSPWNNPEPMSYTRKVVIVDYFDRFCYGPVCGYQTLDNKTVWIHHEWNIYRYERIFRGGGHNGA